MAEPDIPPAKPNGAEKSNVMELLISLDLDTGVLIVDSSKQSVVLAIGMLEYALMLVKRQDAIAAAALARMNAPTIFVPGRPS
jgi:hypothetical protein